MTQPKYRVVSSIREEGTSYPVVVHVFNAMSEAEALGLYHAHQRTDFFCAGACAASSAASGAARDTWCRGGTGGSGV